MNEESSSALHFLGKMEQALQKLEHDTRCNQFILVRAMLALDEPQWPRYSDHRTNYELGLLLYTMLVEYNKKCFLRPPEYEELRKRYNTQDDPTPFQYHDETFYQKTYALLVELTAHLQNH